MESQAWGAALLAFSRALALDARHAGAWLDRAWCHLQLADLGAARADLDSLLSIDPDHAQALALLGRVHLAQGNLEDGVVWLERARLAAPEDGVIARQALQARLLLPGAEAAAMHTALALARRGHLDEATARELSQVLGLSDVGVAQEHAFWVALSQLPQPAGWVFEGWVAFCIRYQRSDEASLAATLWRQQEPASALARSALVHLHTARGDLEACIPLLLEALTQNPDDADAVGQLALVLFRARLAPDYLDAAGLVLTHALELEPRKPELWNLRGSIRLGRFEGAAALNDFQQALALAPDRVRTHCLLAEALRQLGRFDEALEILERLNPDNALDAACVWATVGTVRRAQGRLPQAAAALRQALALDNDDVFAAHLSHVLLAQGAYAEGFALGRRTALSGRPTVHAHRALNLGARQWHGDWAEAVGQTLLVTSDNGIGDVFQFGRFLPALLERGVKVVLQTYYGTGALMRSLHSRIEVIEFSDPLPVTELHCELMRLPELLDLRLESIERHGPAHCLHVSPQAVSAMGLHLGPAQGRLRVALAWRGTNSAQAERSIVLAELADALDRAAAGRGGVEWFSLQHELMDVDREAAQRLNLRHEGWSFDEVAAALLNMDLVVTIDTVFAHLAGALDMPTLVLLPALADWRWGAQGATTPWYPRAELFRQQQWSDWSHPLDAVVSRLHGQMAKGAGAHEG